METRRQPEVFTRWLKLKANTLCPSLDALGLVGPLFLGFYASGLAQLAWGRAASWPVGLVGLGLALVMGDLVRQRTFLLINTPLRRSLAAALERRFGRNPDDGTAYFVGWSPGRKLNPKEGAADHDVGFLTLEPAKISYLGDTVGFELRREEVRWVGPSEEWGPLFTGFGLRIRLLWGDANGEENAFTIERREGRTRRQVRAGNRELAALLQQWHQHGTVPAAAAGEGKP